MSSDDPRYELVQQLLAYKRFKDAAHVLERQRNAFAGRWPRQPAGRGGPREERELDLSDASVWDLLEIFSDLMDQVGGPRSVAVIHDDTPIELYETDLVDRLERDGPITLQAAMKGRPVAEMVGLLLALLEL